jgi:subtilisin family serine protease
MYDESKVKAYPEIIILNDSKLRKLNTKVYIRFQPNANYSQISKFLMEKKGLKTDVSAYLSENNVNDQERGEQQGREVVLEFDGSLGPIDETIHNLEIDELVDVASPVYKNEELGFDNNLSFNNHIIVVVQEEASEDSLKDFFSSLGLAETGRIHEKKIVLSTIDNKKQNVYELTEKLKDNGSLIKFADLNWIELDNPFCSIPNDPLFKFQWSLCNTKQTLPDGDTGTDGCDVKAIHAWDISKGSPLIAIAIIDSGCNLTHEDLEPQYVQQNRWFDATSTNPNSKPIDTIGHGTRCAGIAAASTNSLTPKGVASLGRNCRIMPIRVWTGTGFIEQEKIQYSLEAAIKNEAKVISMSFALNDPLIDTLKDGLDRCNTQGIVLIASSGNKSKERASDRNNAVSTSLRAPANHPAVIAVGASNEHDWRCTLQEDWAPWIIYTGSEYGVQLSVVAPGVYLHTTDVNGGYCNDFYGTSASAPLVAGLAGLILAYNPTLTPAQVREVIEQSADQVGICREIFSDPAGTQRDEEKTRIENDYNSYAAKPNWNPFMGHGRVNAEEALKYVQKTYSYQPVDVFIRDSLTDDGTVPYLNEPLCFSPDIIVRQNTTNNPQIDFSDMTIDPGSDPVALGKPNYIYVRVHNKGISESKIHVRLYYAPLSTSCTPDQWTYINQYDFFNVAPNASAISNEILWENVPIPGTVDHYCLIASIEGVQDPHPDPRDITSSLEYMDFIRNKNNISYRNLVFEQVLPNTILPIPFYMFGFNNDEAKSKLRIIKHKGSENVPIELRLPIGLLKKSPLHLSNLYEIKGEKSDEYRNFKLRKCKNASINELIFPKGLNISSLSIRIPENSTPRTNFHFSVQQLIGEKVLGDFQIIVQVLDH